MLHPLNYRSVPKREIRRHSRTCAALAQQEMPACRLLVWDSDDRQFYHTKKEYPYLETRIQAHKTK
jgi:hypothetical protein